MLNGFRTDGMTPAQQVLVLEKTAPPALADRIRAVLHRPPATPLVYERSGFCPCCRMDTRFTADNPWLRDFYRCTLCGSVPRQRHLIAILDAEFPNWPRKAIHESSPSNDFISRRAPLYTSSQFVPGVPVGDMRNGVWCEDIEHTTFDDESVDLFVTQDVMEHVFHPAEALREIHRVIRPGGAHVFTAPTHTFLERSICRATRAADGVITNLQPAEYHGSPVGDGRALVTWDYGQDAQRLFEQWSGAAVQIFDTPDPEKGIEAELLRVYVIRKPLRSI